MINFQDSILLRYFVPCFCESWISAKSIGIQEYEIHQGNVPPI
jgi:hypothetical protein